MIWKFHFSRNTLLWILGICFVAGVGYQFARDALDTTLDMPVGMVTGTPEAKALRRQADSVMLVREELARAPININTASAQELQRIHGIGKVLSKRIVDYREKNGLFKSVDELINVSGIGPRKLEAAKEQCVLTDEQAGSFSQEK